MSEPSAPSGNSPWLPRETTTKAPQPGPDDRQPPNVVEAGQGADQQQPVRRPPASQRRRPGLGGDLVLPAWFVALVAVTFVVAVTACVVLATRQDNAAAGTAHAAKVADRSAVTVRALDDPFVLSGARWAVFANPAQAWTSFASKVSAGPGRRWLLVTVRVHNLTRRGFLPAALDFSLVDDIGRAYERNRAHSTPTQSLLPVPVDAYGTVYLAFSVPSQQRQFRLRYHPGREPTPLVDVPLGNA